MTIATIITDGYGSFTDISHALLQGFGPESLAAAPTGIKATTNDLVPNYGVTVTWDDYASASYYSLYINGAWDSDTATGVNMAVVTSTVNTDLYSVSATVSAVETATSEQVSITLPAKKTLFRHSTKRSRRIV